MGTAFVVTSGKGGVGKTTVTANLGVGLAKLGKKVILVDMDLGLKNLDVALDLEWNVRYDLLDVVRGVCAPEEALVEDERFPGLRLLAARQSCDKSAVTPMEAKALVQALKQLADVVLVDCPAGIEQGFENAVAGADAAIVVMLSELSSVRDGDRIAGLLREKNIAEVYLVANRIDGRLMKRDRRFAYDELPKTMGIPLLGVVPEDVHVLRSLSAGVPIVTLDTPAGLALRNICRRVNGEEVPLLKVNGAKVRRLARRAWRKDALRGKGTLI